MAIDYNELIIDNLNIARNIAWKYSKRFNGLIPYDELQSIAYEGLVIAAKKFNPKLGFTFGTFSYKVICNNIRIYLRNNGKYFTDISLQSEFQEDLEVEDMIADDLDIENSISNKLIIEQLYNEINNLQERYKSILLYKLSGLTESQIGKKLNISQSVVNRDYQKALNILRDKFKGGEY